MINADTLKRAMKKFELADPDDPDNPFIDFVSPYYDLSGDIDKDDNSLFNIFIMYPLGEPMVIGAIRLSDLHLFIYRPPEETTWVDLDAIQWLSEQDYSSHDDSNNKNYVERIIEFKNNYPAELLIKKALDYMQEWMEWSLAASQKAFDNCEKALGKYYEITHNHID